MCPRVRNIIAANLLALIIIKLNFSNSYMIEVFCSFCNNFQDRIHLVTWKDPENGLRFMIKDISK